ncbi:MAG: DUF92 domain-containing protein [Ardenticatenia bacterium]|nr:DUF92 domain-containing protein [Ardenticatenia bacterium]
MGWPMFYPETLELRLLLGLVLGGCVGGVGVWRRWLRRDGGVAATLVGATVFTFGGWGWAVLLVLFFVASSLLSKYGAARKEIAVSRVTKGGPRDAAQVLANGGWLALLALWQAYQPAPWVPLAAIGALAAVTADTWSTELGLLSPTPPRLITSGRTVPPGTNGGITLLGLLGAATGASLMGFVAGLLVLVGSVPADLSPGRLAAVTVASGLVGTGVDSLLGATLQAVRWCPLCQEETEQDPHTCGTATHALRGWPWLDNDVVNAVSSVAGSFAAVLLALLVGLL